MSNLTSSQVFRPSSCDLCGELSNKTVWTFESPTQPQTALCKIRLSSSTFQTKSSEIRETQIVEPHITDSKGITTIYV